MMYRDESLVAHERMHRLRAEVARLRSRPLPPDARKLRAQLRRRRRELVRARRALARLRHPVLRLLPRSMTELVLSAGLAYTLLLVALVIGALAVPLA